MMPEALEAVFHEFTSSSEKLELSKQEQQYQYIAADGSTISFFSFSKYSSDDYFISEGHSASGFYSIHINAFYDINKRIYTDAILQSAHKKDGGYCYYNNMAHVIEKEQYFVFRTKDITSKGLIGNFVFPDSDTFDITVDVTLTRSHRKSIKIKDGFYRRYVDQAASFDYIKYGSEDTYECLVTNLPEKKFSAEKLKEIYNSRWWIESSFRKLKYTIGLSHYHSYKPDFIKQEIWAKFIAYNATELLIAHTVVTHGKRKYSYKVNFTLAVHICRIYLRLHTETDSMNVMALLQKELVPIRCDRQFPRLKTAHFRKTKYLIYRVS